MACKFGNVRERDIDLMLLNTFSVDADFLKLFTAKLGREDFAAPELIDVELSKVDPVWGESDVTVRFECNGRRFALLIEDKVGAEAQPEQCKRYYKRGEIGMAKDEYVEFFVFICASEEYIMNNDEAKHYPYTMSFEELDNYLCTKSNVYSEVQRELIEQALIFSKVPYKKVVDETATQFWHDYVEYKNRYYPDLQLPNKSREKSKKGDWPVYNTQLNLRKLIYIQHKMDRGFIDLTFSGMANRQPELCAFLNEQIGNYESMGLGVEVAGNSAVLRKSEDKGLDFQKPFEEQLEVAKMHFEALYKLHKLAALIDRDKLIRLLENKCLAQ